MTGAFRKIVLCCLCFLILLLMAAGMRPLAAKAAEGSETTEIKNGWITEKDSTFYYKKGKKLSGWQKIKGKYYYLSKKKGLMKNTVAGTKKTGFYYVDKDGVRIKNKVMNRAAQFVMKNTDPSHSAVKRLKEAFQKLRKYPYKRYYNDKPSSELIPSYANTMLKNGRGNCYRYASAYAYVARALGFDVRVAAGGTTAYRGRSLSPHGWCEVKVNKKWLIVDCSMARSRANEPLCLVSRSKYPFKLRCDKLFTMKIRDHKITWKAKKAPWNNLKSKNLHLS